MSRFQLVPGVALILLVISAQSSEQPVSPSMSGAANYGIKAILQEQLIFNNSTGMSHFLIALIHKTSLLLERT